MARRLSLLSFVQNLSGYGRVRRVWGFLCVLLVLLCLSTRERGSVGLCWWQGALVACRKKQQIWGGCTRAPASDRSITYRVVPGSLRVSLSCGLLLMRAPRSPHSLRRGLISVLWKPHGGASPRRVWSWSYWTRGFSPLERFQFFAIVHPIKGFLPFERQCRICVVGPKSHGESTTPQLASIWVVINQLNYF